MPWARYPTNTKCLQQRRRLVKLHKQRSVLWVVVSAGPTTLLQHESNELDAYISDLMSDIMLASLHLVQVDPPLILKPTEWSLRAFDIQVQHALRALQLCLDWTASLSIGPIQRLPCMCLTQSPGNRTIQGYWGYMGDKAIFICFNNSTFCQHIQRRMPVSLWFMWPSNQPRHLAGQLKVSGGEAKSRPRKMPLPRLLWS